MPSTRYNHVTGEDQVLTEFQEYMLAPWRSWSVCLLVCFGKKVGILFYFIFIFIFIFIIVILF
jgi:hypothetical protein